MLSAATAVASGAQKRLPARVSEAPERAGGRRDGAWSFVGASEGFNAAPEAVATAPEAL
jgi:hypothetical protein